ncbi:hypothetical protein [Streptomyces syringium]|uniref:hypothetical protein n=1 Tax=Streptomyces syringium TaxID=76729 RepID=UPI0034535AA6
MPVAGQPADALSLGRSTPALPRPPARRGPGDGPRLRPCPLLHPPGLLDAAVESGATAFTAWPASRHEDRRARLLACRGARSARVGEGAVADESFTDGRGSRTVVRRVPHGVVAALVRSGFPVHLSVCEVAAALLAVNAERSGC